MMKSPFSKLGPLVPESYSKPRDNFSIFKTDLKLNSIEEQIVVFPPWALIG